MSHTITQPCSDKPATVDHYMAIKFMRRAMVLSQPILLWIVTASLLGFIAVVVWRPFGWHTATHNTWVLVLLGTLCCSLAVAAYSVNSAQSWALLTAHVVVGGFLIRSVPVLVLPYPPQHDGYFYYVTLINLVDAHSLDGIFRNWYSDVGRQLHWPVLQLLSAQVSAWSGIPLSGTWRFLGPAVGSLTAVAVGLVAYNVYLSWRIAAIAGLLGSLSDLVLYYQSEYQPQGTAIVIFTFFIGMVVVSRSSARVGVRALTLLVGATFLFTHHASSLVLPLLLTPVLIVYYARRALPFLSDVKQRLANAPRHRGEESNWQAQFGSIIVILIVASLALHIYLSSDILKVALRTLDNPFLAATSRSTASGTAVEWISALRLGKYFLLALCILGMALALRRLSPSRTVLIMLTFSLFIAALVGDVLAPDGTTRFLALWYPFAAIFAASALVTMGSGPKYWTVLGSAVAVLMIGVYIGVGIADSQIPAYMFDNTPRSAGIWYGNELPQTNDIALAGRWLGRSTPKTARFAVDFATRMAPFFFGARSDSQIIYDPATADSYCRADYVVVDYKLEQGQFMQPRVTINYSQYPRVYDNGSVAVFRHVYGSLCSEDSKAVIGGTLSLLHRSSVRR